MFGSSVQFAFSDNGCRSPESPRMTTLTLTRNRRLGAAGGSSITSPRKISPTMITFICISLRSTMMIRDPLSCVYPLR